MGPGGTWTTVDRFDVAIVGAGVVGCALARAFAVAGARVILLERGRDILSGASKGNSALFHTGYDTEPDSLELDCIRRGREEFLAIKDALNLPLRNTSALLVAWNEEQQARLGALLARAHANGVSGAAALDRRALRTREPGLGDGAVAGISIPGEDIMDPWSTPLAYAHQALAAGARIERGCEVLDGTLSGATWELRTCRGVLQAEVVVNAAGLFGDLVEAIARPAPFHITPRNGQFVVLDKSASSEIRSIILPVPTERTKGVLVAPTIFGNVLIGPSAEDQVDREHAGVDTDTLAALLEHGRRIIPALAEHPIVATYAGLRPATEFKDYRIDVLPDRQWITVAGIRSTGLTSALGIAAYVLDRYEQHFRILHPPARVTATPVPNLAEHRTRPYQVGGSGEIVCHCEWVTRGEIEAALKGPLPALDIGGLRRRTRCMLGRCQGFYCGWQVARLTEGRIHWPFPEREAA